MRAALLCLALAACSFEVPQADADMCRRLEAVIDALLVRCKGHHVSPSKYECDKVISSDLDDAGLERCRAYAASVTCEELAARTPDAPASPCYFNFVRLP